MPQSATFSLPLHSDELGRLPLHGQVQFSNNNNPSMDATDQFWLSALGETAQSNPTSAPNVAAVDPAASAFPMEYVFYEQMDNNLLSASNPPQDTAQGQFSGIGHPMAAPASNQQQFPGQAWTNSDTIAMWSNAPTGFECVVFC
jgi:hypothetical protein